MSIDKGRAGSSTMRRRLRVLWAVVSILVVEGVVLSLAALPATLLFEWLLGDTERSRWAMIVRVVAGAMSSYLAFALAVIVLSAAAMRMMRWRSPANATAPLDELGWPLLVWARYLISIHVVRLFAGPVFRSTPVWTWYLRLNGAKIGRGVWVNSLALMDHNLLELGEHTVVGSDAHISGHIVEGGVLRTAGIRIGRNVTIGVGSVIEIGAEIGDCAVIGALSVVPKHARLDGHATYVGAPVRRLADTSSPRREPVVASAIDRL